MSQTGLYMAFNFEEKTVNGTFSYLENTSSLKKRCLLGHLILLSAFPNIRQNHYRHYHSQTC